MSLRIHNDQSRFKDIVRGKIKENLKNYIQKGELIGKQGKDKITIPVPRIDFRRFETKAKEAGQGDKLGDAVEGQPGDGEGQPGEAGFEAATTLETEVTLEELADMLAGFELPRIENRVQNLTIDHIKYTGISTVGELAAFQVTFKQALHDNHGQLQIERPIIVPIRDDKRYRSCKTYANLRATRSSFT